MARGVFSGLIWGVIVAGAGAGGLSLAYPEFKPEMVAPRALAEADEVDAAQPLADDAAPKAEVEAEVEGSDAQGPSDAAGRDEASDVAVEATDEASTENNEAEQSAAVAAAQDAETAPVTEPETETTDAPAPEADAAASQEQPQTEGVTPEPVQDPEPSEPSGTVGDLAPNVTTGRLPSLSDDGADAGASAVAPPPLVRFASDVEIDNSKPLMSIVLIDDGSTDLGFDALESFPYPLTFAVDASTPDAEARMQDYRARGLEVVSLVAMPQGATAADAEVAMASILSNVPEAVAILEDPDASLQVNRGVSDQVVDILKSSGHGIVFQSSGLNTAQKLAVREGVGAARVFRDFDGADQSATVIRRFLDQAAFRAGQEGGVVMLGRLRAETISALLVWGLADRASRVSLVPVSAVLQKSLVGAE